MQINGAIYPVANVGTFSHETWCQFIDRRVEFRRSQSREVRNPFTRAPFVLKPRADAAEVILEGRSVGNVYWSMSEEPLVNVSVDPVAMHLVMEWAAELGGEFRPNLSESEPD